MKNDVSEMGHIKVPSFKETLYPFEERIGQVGVNDSKQHTPYPFAGICCVLYTIHNNCVTHSFFAPSN